MAGNSLDQIKDDKLKEAVRLELKKRARRRRIFTILVALIAIGSLGYFGIYSYMNFKTQNKSSQLATLKEQTKPNKKDTDDEPVKVNKTGEIEIPDILPEYEMLYNKNKSLIGWIKIDDTIIDYPVMQAGNNEYYLDHNFDQGYDKNGCIFMDTECDVLTPSTNLILYGHHMKSGAMFGGLDKYASREYFEKHPTFQFDTIYEKGVYKIAYVFRSQVYSEDEIIFKYYQFINANSETEFNSNIVEMSKLSLYDTGITPVYGDELVTLSTCDRSQVNEGRFVVVGVKIKDEM